MVAISASIRAIGICGGWLVGDEGGSIVRVLLKIRLVRIILRYICVTRHGTAVVLPFFRSNTAVADILRLGLIRLD